MNSALSRCRVLDLTDDKGAFCSRLLADMGADVIRVEKLKADSARNLSLAADNLGKRSITLNPKAKQEKALFSYQRLLSRSDEEGV